METIAHHARVLEPARQRVQLRHTGHPPVERGVETGHLGQLWQSVADGFDRAYRLRQVIRIYWRQVSKCLEELRGDRLWLPVVAAAMHHPVPCCCEVVVRTVILQPREERPQGRLVTRQRLLLLEKPGTWESAIRIRLSADPIRSARAPISSVPVPSSGYSAAFKLEEPVFTVRMLCCLARSMAIIPSVPTSAFDACGGRTTPRTSSPGAAPRPG